MNQGVVSASDRRRLSVPMASSTKDRALGGEGFRGSGGSSPATPAALGRVERGQGLPADTGLSTCKSASANDERPRLEAGPHLRATKRGLNWRLVGVVMSQGSL